MKKQIQRIRKLDYLIKTRTTGNPKDLSNKLNLSERMVYECINTLKTEFNAPVKYSKIQQTYYYEFKGAIKIEWCEK